MFSIKNKLKFLGIIAIVTIIGFTAIGCSAGDDPKALAKQAYELIMQLEGTDTQEEAIMEKIEALDEKVRKLPEAKQLIFNAELERLYTN